MVLRAIVIVDGDLDRSSRSRLAGGIGVWLPAEDLSATTKHQSTSLGQLLACQVGSSQRRPRVRCEIFVSA